MVTSGATVAAPAGLALPQGMPPSPLSPAESIPQRRSAENRRSNKPIMEKRRRARINNCLNELKTLILDAMKKDPARHSKLEKADILEMTVKHLENMQRQQVALATATDPSVINKYRAGFSECAGEVGRFPGLEAGIRRRLLQHLAACLGNSNSAEVVSGHGAQSPPPAATTPPTTPLQLHLVSSETSPNGTPALQGAVNNTANGIFFTTGSNGAGLQLVPTRLPNGDIALVLPSSRAGQLGQVVAEQQAEAVVKASPPPSPAPATTPLPASSPLPMLIPIPQRTASTASATSSASASSFVSTSSTSPASYDRLSVHSPPQTQAHNLSTMHSLPAGSPEMPIAYPPSPLSNSSNSCGYEIHAYTQEEHKPLALVTNRKKYDMMEVEEEPWRPW
ncbi:Protein hairy [Frankliniella fusca]|uniref:Protein hairy n=1 Tax=Frankliniella fusca TaxID=407009 RepID=A0AAE1HUZ6_9NEOP|nr:Protein hairy [Frankliniella fusca]